MLVWLLHLCFLSQTGTSLNFKHNRQLTHRRNTVARSHNHCCHAKAMCYRFWVCICSLSYLARKAHAPYCTVICGLSRSTILSTLSHKRYAVRKNVIKQKCVFWFSLQIRSETFLILRGFQQRIIINVHTEYVFT